MADIMDTGSETILDRPASGGEPRLEAGKVGEGARCWIITDGKRGMDVQCEGVASALGLAYEFKHVTPRPPWRLLAPWGPVAPHERFGRAPSPFAPPWPAVAIASGRQSIPYMRALGRHAGAATFRVVLQDPKTGPGVADLIWVPQHDRRRGANVFTTITAPHSFSPARLEALRQETPAAIAGAARPRLAIVLGGPNAVYRFDKEDAARLAAVVSSLMSEVGSVLLTPSRRTPRHLLDAVLEATEGRSRIVWDGSAPNLYPYFLANADHFIVTADSVNMVSEAVATGRPVHVFEPRGGSRKFRRFHNALIAHGAIRMVTGARLRLENWSYVPLYSAAEIAEEIVRRMDLHKSGR